jgi:PIN domain nuclease of toxin-antitoxin system
MAAVVADTHTLVWYLVDPGRLSAPALAALEQAGQSGEPVYLSAITLIELRYLIEKGKLPQVVWDRLDAALAQPGSAFVVAPVDHALAHTLVRVPRDEVSDMPDRIIAATALQLGAPLVSRDRKIRASAVQTIW